MSLAKVSLSLSNKRAVGRLWEGFFNLLFFPSLSPSPPSFSPSLSLVCNIKDFYNLVERKNHWGYRGKSQWSDCCWEEDWVGSRIGVEGVAFVRRMDSTSLLERRQEVLMLWSEPVDILLGLLLTFHWNINLHWEQGERSGCWSDYNNMWLTALFSWWKFY